MYAKLCVTASLKVNNKIIVKHKIICDIDNVENVLKNANLAESKVEVQNQKLRVVGVENNTEMDDYNKAQKYIQTEICL